MNLKRVKVGRALHWPESFGPAEQRVRGLTGYVVDVDAPMEKDWLLGQEHKLEPAPDAKAAAAIEHARAVRELAAVMQPVAPPPRRSRQRAG